jgi:hypothetical protein
LKLRAGLVRCGACKEIFNGIEHLLRADDVPQSAAFSNPAALKTTATHASANVMAERPPSQTSTVSPSAMPSGSEEQKIDQDKAGNPAAPGQSLPDPQVIAPGLVPGAGSEPGDDPLLRMTLMDATAFGKPEEGSHAEAKDLAGTVPLKASIPRRLSLAEEDANAADELGRTIKDLQRRPWRGIKMSALRDAVDERDAAEAAEPGFVKRARRQQRIGRTLRILMSIGSLVLLIGLLLQTAYTFRNQIATRLPQIAPVLADACTIIGCRLDLPAQIDLVSIESSELQALAPNQSTFVLTVLLRNRSATSQLWPSIELTLNDVNEKAIARRVFTARDYLSSSMDLNKGFPANSEQPVKLFFELMQIRASGYRVYLFYP